MIAHARILVPALLVLGTLHGEESHSSFSLKGAVLPLTGAALILDMNGFAAGKEWVVMVRMKTGDVSAGDSQGLEPEDGSIVLADVVLEKASESHFGRVIAATELPASTYQMRPSVVTINTQSIRNNLVVFAEVPRRTRVLIWNAEPS